MTTPPIPASAVHRPTVGGLVAPYVNVELRDGRIDFRSPWTKRVEECWRRGLCQTCGRPISMVAVFFGGPNQLGSRTFDEPHLCAPCAHYASKACPMVAGRQSHYADRDKITQGTGGKVCPDPDCNCQGFIETDQGSSHAAGEPAHAYYAVFVRLDDGRTEWDLTAHQAQVLSHTGNRPELHQMLLISGARLRRVPAKIYLVSEPGAGRIWRRLTDDEVSAVYDIQSDAQVCSTDPDTSARRR